MADEDQTIIVLDDDDEDVQIVIESDAEEDQPCTAKRFRSESSSSDIIDTISRMSSDENIKAVLDSLDFTDRLRVAVHPRVSAFVKKMYGGINGVPLKKGYKLFDYQIEALAWMKDREENSFHGILGGILCLQMGMGKTLTALTHILMNEKGEFPSLIIASKTVLSEWFQQGCQKFFEEGSVKTLFLHKDFLGKDIEKVTQHDVKGFDIVLTTYDVLVALNQDNGKYFEGCLESQGSRVVVNTRLKTTANIPSLSGASVIYGIPWHRVICDESQRFANPKTNIHKCVMAVYGKYKWCLSGTPIRNYKTDIWSQLRFCGYTSIDHHTDWNRLCKRQFEQDNLNSAIFSKSYDDAHVVLPPIHEHHIKVEISGFQKKLYDSIVKKTREVYQLFTGGSGDFAGVLALLIRLRQCVIAPYLLTTFSKRASTGEFAIQPDLQVACNQKEGEAGFHAVKIRKIVEVIQSIPSTEKIVFFTMFTSYLDLVYDTVTTLMPGKKVLKLDGDTKGPDRLTVLSAFKEDPACNLLLLTYKVGGEGLNITEATHCIYGEPWWTDAVHNQAKARIWRTGQTKEVHVYSIIVKDSIEERILDICKEKTKMASEFLGTSSNYVGLSKFTVGRILGFYF